MRLLQARAVCCRCLLTNGGRCLAFDTRHTRELDDCISSDAAAIAAAAAAAVHTLQTRTPVSH